METVNSTNIRNVATRSGSDSSQQTTVTTGERDLIPGQLLAAEAAGKDELFSQEKEQRPWWKANLLVNSPELFGAWDGVYTTVVVNIFGVIAMLRSGWLVGQAGIALTMVVIAASVCVVLTSVLSAIGICERCRMQSGGIYLLVSQVLGSHVGTAIGLIYCIGQAVGCALCAAAFGESVVDLLHVGDNAWLERSVGATLIGLLTAINLAGVRWVIKIQFVLLAFLATAVVDFLLGSLVSDRQSGSGFIGWNWENLGRNIPSHFTDGNNWFSVFGVFFPSLTGIMAGLNMSGDLKDPRRDIPRGTMAALGTSTGLYVVFTFVLAATCTREALLSDYIIAERVAATGVFILLGLYISSFSSCLATLYGTPRVLQSIANENIIHALLPLGKGRGPNQVPVNALLCLSAASLLFILIGQVNRLAPMVTLPFLMTYACIDYAYFALANAYDSQQQCRDIRQPNVGIFDSDTNKSQMYGSTENGDQSAYIYGAVNEKSAGCATVSKDPEKSSDTTTQRKGDPDTQIHVQPCSWYSRFCNRWLSLAGFLVKLVMMLLVNWLYCMLSILALTALWLYARSATPACPAGLADNFSLYEWISSGIAKLTGRKPSPQPGTGQVILSPATPGIVVQATQVTSENSDFQHRNKYHHSTLQSSPYLP